MSEAHCDPKTDPRLRKVLVVDNDAIMLKFLSRILEKAGMQVVTATDGVTAIDILESYTPDLFFIDLVMPNIDGRALCRIIRSKAEFKAAPIVIVSAIAAEEAIDTVELGANVCIAKVAFAQMEATINTFLNNPRLLWDPELGNRVLGVDALSPRNITNELLTINRHFRIMLDSITNGIIEFDRNQRIIYANSAALRFFSMAPEIMLGSHLQRLFQDETDKLQCSGPEAFASKDGMNDRRVKIKIQKCVLAVTVVASNYNSDTRVIIMEDITERETAQKKLFEANQKLEVLARVDGLTHVFNRRHFDELLHKEWARLRREKGQLALILCDVDYFKNYNDTYGHLEGDECLRNIAGAIHTTLRRPSDVVARFGGDEFVILLPNTLLEGAMHLAQEIRERVARLRLKHEKSPVADHVTVTTGVSSGFPAEALPEDKFVWLADKALYEAKLKGRNCTVGKTWPPA